MPGDRLAHAAVEEALKHGENGLLVDFFDVEGWAATIARALADPAAFAPLRKAARRAVLERYDLRSICLPRQLRLIEAMAAGADPGVLAAI